MMGLSELIEDRRFRRPFFACAAAAVVWVVFFVLASWVSARNSESFSNAADGARILDYAMRYRVLPRIGPDIPLLREDPLGALSQIVDALGLRDRMQQLQSNQSGVTIQLERLYGEEMSDFLNAAEGRGLDIKTAEIRVLPEGNGRVLNAVFVLEPSR
jgi:hypothetical protein